MVKAIFIGIDYGERRMGIAFAFPHIGVSFAYSTERVNGYASMIAAISRCIVGLQKEYHIPVTTIIIGVPYSDHGAVLGKTCKAVLMFAEKLRLEFGNTMHIETYSEYGSSDMAKDAYINNRYTEAERKSNLDAIAAQIILDGFMKSS